MHTFLSHLERLDEQQKAIDAGRDIVPERPGYRHTRHWLQLQLLASVAREVVSLRVQKRWQKMELDLDELFHKPQHLLAQMPLLESCHQQR